MQATFILNHYTIEYATPSAVEILKKRTDDAVIGISILDCVKGKNASLLQNEVERLISGIIDECQTKFTTANPLAPQKKYSLQLSLISNIKGEVKICGTFQKMDFLQKSTSVPPQLDRKYEALYKDNLDCVCIYDYLNEKLVAANNVTVKLLEYKSEKEMIGISRLDFIPQYSSFFPDMDLHEATANHGTKILSGEAFSTRGIFNTKSGKHILVDAKMVPTFHQKGEGFILFQDITSKVYDKLARKESEKKYRYIFENSHEAIIYVDLLTQKASICNKNALNICGVSSIEELQEFRLENFVTDTKIEGSTPKDFFTSLIKKAIKNKRAEAAFWIRSKKNKKRRVQSVLISDKSDPNKPMVVLFMRDVTNLHLIKEALTTKNQELQKYIVSNLELENFAYFASHDLQTPLRTIISFTQLLKRSLGGRLTEGEQDYINFIVSSSKSMKVLIDDLLLFSRINTAKLALSPIIIEDLFHSILIDLDSLIKEKKVTLTFNNLPKSIKADYLKLKQVFQNLLTNGIKFMKDEVVPTIQISCLEESTQWLFSVKDNGIGIAPEFQEKIFGMFKRLHNTQEYEGTGIGLAIVKKIIEQHNGKIWIESNLGEGTAFWFTIPK